MSCRTDTLAAYASLDAAGRIVAWSLAAEEALGWTRREILLRDAADVLVPRERVAAFDALLARVRAGEAPSGRHRAALRTRDGSERVVTLTVATVAVEGHPHLVAWIADAAGEPSDGERAGRRAAAFEHAAAAMAVVDDAGTYLEVNHATARMLRRERGRLQGGDARRVVHPADLSPVLSAGRRVRSGASRSASLDARLMLPGGGIVWGRLTFAAGDGDALVVTAEDVTQRRSAELHVAEAARRLQDAEGVDPLTGLLADEAFAAALAARLDAGEPSALLVLDLDLPSVEDRSRRAELDLLVGRVAGPFAALWLAGEPTGRVGATRLAATYAAGEPDHAGDLAEHVQDVVRAVDPRATVRALVVRPEADENAADLLLRAAAGLDAAADMAAPSAVSGRIGEILARAREHLGVEVTFLSRIDGGELRFAAIDGPGVRFGLEEGGGARVEDVYCAPMLAGRTGHIVDTLAEPLARDLAPTAAGIRTYVGVPVHLPDGSLYGTLCAIDGSRRAPQLDERDVGLLRFLATIVGETLADDRRRAAARQATAESTGVAALLATLEARDRYTSDHSRAVVELAARVAQRLGLDAEELESVRQVALLHDIGKVGMPDALLQKQGPLDSEEWTLMRRHPAIGARIVAGIPGLAHLAPAIRAEHERWDGGGYPDGLAREQIPLASRIVLACDALHAMTSHRPYRPALTLEQAGAELRANAGSQFAPEVVEAVLAELDGGTLEGRAPSHP